MTRYLARAAVLAATLLLAPGWGVAAAAEDPHISRIERNLEPSVQIAGRPVMRHTLAEAMADHNLPAVSVAVADGGKIVWAKAWGYADTAAGVRATPRTIFQAGSISKPVAASAAMQMAQEGKLRLDEPANDQLKSWRIPDNAFTQGHPVTLRHLLTHTAGTTVHGFPGYAAGAPVPTVVQVLEGKPPANTPAVVVESTPGTRWNYSGGGITIAQLIMTDVSGQAFPDLMRRRILGPAGMTASTYEQPLPASRHDNAVGYLADGKPVLGRFHTYPEMAAAGLWTTPSDLVRWALAMQAAKDGRSTRLMSQASAKEMLTPGLGSWGVGVQIEGAGGPPDAVRFYHGGDDAGFNDILTAYMTGGRAIAVMTNGDDGAIVAQEVVAAIAREYGWKGYEPRVIKAADLTDAQKAELVGSYASGRLVISLRGSVIDGQVEGRRTEVVPRGADFFVLAASEVLLRAQRGPDGKVIALIGVPSGVVYKRDP